MNRIPSLRICRSAGCSFTQLATIGRQTRECCRRSSWHVQDLARAWVNKQKNRCVHSHLRHTPDDGPGKVATFVSSCMSDPLGYSISRIGGSVWIAPVESFYFHDGKWRYVRTRSCTMQMPTMTITVITTRIMTMIGGHRLAIMMTIMAVIVLWPWC